MVIEKALDYICDQLSEELDIDVDWYYTSDGPIVIKFWAEVLNIPIEKALVEKDIIDDVVEYLKEQYLKESEEEKGYCVKED